MNMQWKVFLIYFYYFLIFSWLRIIFDFSVCFKIFLNIFYQNNNFKKENIELLFALYIEGNGTDKILNNSHQKQLKFWYLNYIKLHISFHFFSYLFNS